MSGFLDDITRRLLFPKPDPPHYRHNSFPDSMIWLPKTRLMRYPIPCLWLPYTNADVLIIFSHGNGCDLGSMYETMRHYRDFWQAHILAWEYPGYGCHLGTPSEEAINSGIREVYTFARQVLKWPSERIVFFGQSLGTGPSCYLSSVLNRHGVTTGGLILLSPFTSIVDATDAFAGSIAAAFVEDRWRNIDQVKKAQAPLLIIHGQQDSLIPWQQSRALYAAATTTQKHLLLIKDATHNEYQFHQDVVGPVRLFLQQYLRTGDSKEPVTCPAVEVDRALFAVPPIIVQSEGTESAKKQEQKEFWGGLKGMLA